MATSSIPKSSGVYIIRCLANGKIYVGSAVNLRRRWYEHRNHLRSGKHCNSHLQRAWGKYGETGFEFQILELAISSALIERENYWLEDLKPYQHETGFNIGKTAESGMKGRQHSPETRAKISSANKGRKATPEQIERSAQAHTGLKRRPETRARMRAASKKRVTPEYRAKLSAANKGKQPSMAARLASAARKGIQLSPETRAKMSAARMGRKMSPESIAKTVSTRKAKGNYAHSEETRKHLSAIRYGTQIPSKQRDYIVTTPDGEELSIKGLYAFCREHGLNYGNMNLVANGRRTHYKGWKCRHA